MTELPSGTVTFLFTDVERSTARWERNAAAMRPAVERHFTLLRQAVAAHGGVVFRTIGDAVQAAFATAPAALAAALDAQRALMAEPWPEATGELRVRMALHTGEAHPQDGDYLVVPALNRLARLVAAGHGGQVLVSTATQELVRDALPPGSSLRDRGEHRLKDLLRPERVYELLAPDLPADFPPLKTLDARPNNLPLQPTPLVGREQEVTQVRDLLKGDEVRLLTLTGPGGAGKTRLAFEAAAGLIDAFDDGVWFVPLDPLTNPALVPAAVADVLGVRRGGGHPLVTSLHAFLRGKRLLLLLDHFDHLRAAAPIVADLLGTAPGLKVLITSRTPLGLGEERPFPIPAFAVPGLEHQQWEAERGNLRVALDWAWEHDAEGAATLAEALRRFSHGHHS